MFRRTDLKARTCAIAIALLGAWAAGDLCAAGQSLTIAKGCRQMSARVVKKLSVPRSYHEGLYYDGKSMWLSNGEGGRTWVIDTDSGAVLSEIETVACFTEAITAKGDGTYFTTEWDEKKVYRARLEGNRLVAESSVSVAPAHPAGAVWNGRSLYVILWNRGILGTKFSIVEMDGNMEIVRKVAISAIQEPCQLAWDGTYLWMTSWYDQKAYKIDTDSWEVVGYFCTSLDKTTGIAWDGKCLWLTATYDDLYRMEIAE